jgi:hypothetical protein
LQPIIEKQLSKMPLEKGSGLARDMHRIMARSILPKAFGVRWGVLADATTWQPLPPSMLRLLVQIADAEKRLDAPCVARDADAKEATPVAHEPCPGT